MIKIVVNGFLTLLSITYPIAILSKIDTVWLGYFPYGLGILWGLKGYFTTAMQRQFAFFMAVLLLFIGLTRTLNLMYWYPVIMNAVMLAVFGSSLKSKQSFVERLARLQDPNLPNAAIAYTRKVTQIWCIVFISNIIISISLIELNKIDWWAIYTGGIAYLIMGIIFVGEWLIRPKHH